MFQMTKDEVKARALAALTAIVRELATPALTAEGAGVLAPLCADAVAHINDYDLGMIELHTRLLAAVVAAGPAPAAAVFRDYVLHVVERVGSLDTEHRLALLDSLRALLQARASPAADDEAFAATRPGLLAMLVLVAFASSEPLAVRHRAVAVLRALVGSLSPPEYVQLCRQILETLDDASTAGELRDSLLDLLAAIGCTLPAVIINQVAKQKKKTEKEGKDELKELERKAEVIGGWQLSFFFVLSNWFMLG